MRGAQSLARIAGPSSRGFTSTCAASTSGVAPATSTSPRRPSGAQRAAMKEAKKKDDKLRRAVELYHLTSYFFPTPNNAEAPTASSALSSSGTTRKQAEALDEERINAHIRDELAVAIDDRDSVTMRSAHVVLDGERNGFLGEDINRAGQAFLRNTRATSRGLFDTDLDLERQRDEDEQGELPLPADRKATADYISKLASSRDVVLTRQKFEELNVENMRSMRVRDALFGTTGGSLPGLEVVRERIEERKAREAQES
ncbi:hypothetical protein FA10DRAFT_266818 [Acaromyces ingoldii]|uniref:Uncharacterized protein n=1 Tax=Acaromyces ingoldii TaxID=215250 RepID=A0A316YNU4_9BASI|nr:hypothetical protein FA10DRAFT_266818 [Acaromyces ingoldii]PWN90328.1 hypothetical protein FA10DRAFT_266818 [Acaromyces ingoldii]